MNPFDAEEIREFRAELRQFLSDHREQAPEDTIITYRLDPRPYPQEVLDWQKLLVENGYVHRTVPKDYGGFGADYDPIIDFVIDEEFLAAGLPRGLSDIGTHMFVPTLLAHGSDEQKRRWVRPSILGEIFWCQGYSEPEAGSDLASLRTRAAVEDDHYVINGQKIWTSSAHIARMMFCLVRTEPEARKHAGISYVMIPMDTPGIEVRPIPMATGHASFNEVFFTDVRVPVANTIGGRGNGWKVANSTLGHERSMMSNGTLSCRRLGYIRSLLKRAGPQARGIETLTARYVALQARVQALRAQELSLACGGTGANPLPGLVLKYVSCELNYDLDALAIDLLGKAASGNDLSTRFDTDQVWHQLLNYDLGMIIGGGTAQIQKNIIAERGLGMPREPALPWG